MIGLSGTTFLLISILIPALNPLNTPNTSPSDFITPDKDYTYVVKEGDTLASIAKEKYGNQAYWTIIWNDNLNLSNPNIIHSDLELKVRTKKPVFVEQPNREYVLKVTPTPLLHVEVISAGTEATIHIQAEEIASQHIPDPILHQAKGPLSEEQLTYLGNCEAGMDPAKNTGNGFYGAFQFMDSTWDNLQTGYERADLAPLDVQKEAVQKLLSRSSIFNQFPACSRMMQAVGLI